MIRAFLALLALFVSIPVFAQKIVDISPSAPSYEAGETAQVRMRLVAVPESPGYEFFLKASFDAAAVDVKKITGTEFYSLLP